MTERSCVNDHSLVLTQVVTFSNIINIAHRRAVDVVLWVTEWFTAEGGFLCQQQVRFTISQSMLLLLHTGLGVKGIQSVQLPSVLGKTAQDSKHF